LERAGVTMAELDQLKEAWEADADGCLHRLLTWPRTKAERAQRRALLTSLLAALATNDEARTTMVNRWVRERNLVGPLPETMVSFDQQVKVEDAAVPTDWSVEPKLMGQRIGQTLPALFEESGPLALLPAKKPAEIPVEWARENADTDPISWRRQLRWRLAFADHRVPLIEELPDRVLPPRCLLLALKGAHIHPEAEVIALKQALTELYVKLDWPPNFIDLAVCENQDDVETRLRRCSHEVVHVAGHMDGDNLQVASSKIPADEVGQWFANSNVRLVLLNGCDGAVAGSTLALHSISLADRLVQRGRVPEVVAHRMRLNEQDGQAFAISFHGAFLKSFDAVDACFAARQVGSLQLGLSPILISQRASRTG
jgi:hypothetical protein